MVAVIVAPLLVLMIIPLLRLSVNTVAPEVSKTVTVPLLNMHVPDPLVLQPGVKCILEIFIVPKVPVTDTMKLDTAKLPDGSLVTVPISNLPVVKSTVWFVEKSMLFANAAVGKATAKSVNSITRLILALL